MTNLNDLFARDMAFRDIVIETAARAIGSTSKEFTEEWLMAGGDNARSAKRASAVERVRKAKDAGTSIGYAIVGREYYPWEAYETLIELLTDDDGLTNLEWLFIDSEQFRQAVSAFAFVHSDDCPTSPAQMVDWLMAPYVDAQSKDQSKTGSSLTEQSESLSDANDDLAPESDVTADAVDANDETATCNNLGGNVTHDSREKLEADVREYYRIGLPGIQETELNRLYYEQVIEWLDRQAAITAREVKERVDFSLITQTANAMFTDYQEQVDKLQAKVDELTRQLEQSRKLIGDMLDAADAIRLLGGSYGD